MSAPPAGGRRQRAFVALLLLTAGEDRRARAHKPLSPRHATRTLGAHRSYDEQPKLSPYFYKATDTHQPKILEIATLLPPLTSTFSGCRQNPHAAAWSSFCRQGIIQGGSRIHRPGATETTPPMCDADYSHAHCTGVRRTRTTTHAHTRTAHAYDDETKNARSSPAQCTSARPGTTAPRNSARSGSVGPAASRTGPAGGRSDLRQ